MVGAVRPLSESLALAKAKGFEPAKCGYDLCRAILLGVREARCNRPDLVLKFGTHLLQHHSSSLSHEVWAAYEQVYISLLQHARHAARRAVPESGTESEEMRLAQEFIATLSAQFPESLRVKRLEGMMWEAKGEMDLAMTLYDEVLADDPSNLHALKRQIAVSRSRGKYADTASKLVKYLDKFCSDPEAWLMLHELYLAHQQYKRAAFAIEELILINPMNYIYHLRAGEVMYTLGMSERGGSHDQLLTARKYFAHALELKAGCLRALYGILLVCAAIGTSTKGKGTKVDVTVLSKYVEQQLLKAYTPEGAAHPMRPLIGALISTLNAAQSSAAA
jgi:tetratricopeptide (TPR) repeat protein